MIPRSNISIPKPAEDLLAPVITSAPLATAVTSVTKTTTKRGVKLMEANDSFTARYATHTIISIVPSKDYQEPLCHRVP